jgi:hypothetical protein
MAVAKITLESTNGDSVVVSDSTDDYLDDDIILDVDPQGVYDMGFKMRTASGAFERGGRIVGETVPIREPVLPFWLTPESRKRFQRLWGTPGNFQKVRWHYDGPSGRRSLTLRLAKEIVYTTEDGFDADIDESYHAVVSALALNPMFEAAEDVAQWTNPDTRFTVVVTATGGRFPLTFGGQTTNDRFGIVVTGSGGTFPLTFGGQTASGIAYNATPAAVQSALAALSSVGAGNVVVTGTPGNYDVAFSNVTGTLTGSASSLTGLGKSLTITPGLAYNAAPADVRASLEKLSSVGAGKVTVTGTPGNYLVVFAVGTNGVLTSSTANLDGTGLFGQQKSVTIAYAPNTGWFEVWNPTDQLLWLEWTFDPAQQWQFPDWSFGQERRWGRSAGADATRMIVTAPVTSLLSVMSDPFMDTYVCADLSNFAGLMNGVEPIYAVPPYTGTEANPMLMPVVCSGPAGAKVVLRQRRFWSAESGLEA